MSLPTLMEPSEGNIKEPEIKQIRSGSYIRGPVRISGIALSEIVSKDPSIKPYQRSSFVIPKGLRTYIIVNNQIFIPEEVLWINKL